jgi:polyhydroxyalkanoate synthase subunit PhaC
MDADTQQAPLNAWFQAWQSFAQTSAAAAEQAQPDADAVAPADADAQAIKALVEVYGQRASSLLQTMWARAPGAPANPIVKPQPGDRRFSAPEWSEYPYFDYIKQSYLLAAQFWKEYLELAPAAPGQKQRARFWMNRLMDSLAPSNFIGANPEAIRQALASEGASLQSGAANLLRDLEQGRIAMCDPSAFAVGTNLAITPGKVVFRNELIELIQYAPQTAQVYERPLLIVPPCINKYYILDLQPGNSFVRYAVEQGHTVFMVSWRNVPAELGHLSWDDYLSLGVAKAIAVVKSITRAQAINALGFCVGGTLLSCALAVLAARGEASVASATLLTTMLDFAEPGEICVYLDQAALDARAPALEAGSRIHGSELASAFASLRANELVWSFVVNNYLKGKTPAAFDLLYWNSDSANLPGPMYLYYLREMYIGNRLRTPGALTMCGMPVSLKAITIPTYVLATREDHIVPWQSAYKTTGLLSGDIRFVLGASGHIAGVVNPVAKGKRNYWVNAVLARDADGWLAGAVSQPGSWWSDWSDWLVQYGGDKKPVAKRLGSADYPSLADAPGTYVLEKA